VDDAVCAREAGTDRSGPDTEQKAGSRLRYPWIIGSLAAGGVIVAVAVMGNLIWTWREIWSSLLLEIGTTVLLISAVFLVERQFVGQVRRVEARAAVTEARVEEAERTVREALGQCRVEDPPAPIRLILTESGGLKWVCSHTPPHEYDALARSSS
jgi:hypothetical protein